MFLVRNEPQSLNLYLHIRPRHCITFLHPNLEEYQHYAYDTITSKENNVLISSQNKGS